MTDVQDIEAVTTQVKIDGQPDQKTRKYDRQLRLWAASGQSALENARILAISATATSTSILKNLVLPGIGHFTILDPQQVTPQDAGNNFFLEGQNSIGKSRAKEATRLLAELNEDVNSAADERSLEEILESETGREWIKEFTLIIAHNLEKGLLDRLAKLLWEDAKSPTLVVVRSAGFLAEFYIQFHEHTIIDSHSDSTPSLRIDKPFPALLDYALSLDFDKMDPTDHGHVPYVYILVRALEEWKKTHDGKPPQAYSDKKAFKASILSKKFKQDEENFDEAEAQAYRTWSVTGVPSEIQALFKDPLSPSSAANAATPLTPDSPPFFHLLDALRRFTEKEPFVLPLTSTLPDMKANTESYIHLQKLYKKRSEEERDVIRELVKETGGEVDDATLDLFVRNAHAVKVMRGKRWGVLDESEEALGNAVDPSGKPLSIHLALSALSEITAKQISPLTVEAVTKEAQTILPKGKELPEDWDNIVGEMHVFSPTADLPNTAAFLGGMVAQEVIKMITRQYIPIDGYCTADLIETWTGILLA
ncbi:hypothetical protein BDN72DRAFT_888691 [Pluteus cervinus]|uniref:Uncharacterized protein n=1 Tax=Pluteus cervinus TaxID=181527 RepID=A0ACD3ARX0_9AGAR|nr:hypothetical protein BDN72DRAFT_888691 [Pluteus cervinus]